jgi:hypothetical protein
MIFSSCKTNLNLESKEAEAVMGTGAESHSPRHRNIDLKFMKMKFPLKQIGNKFVAAVS